MPLDIQETQIAFGTTILSFEQIADLAARYDIRVAKTRKREHEGAALEKNAFPPKELNRFIRKVCAWGGYTGIAGRVLRNNTSNRIHTQFLAAQKAMQDDRHDVASALAALNVLHGLGRPSFASKHLRLIWPRWCPVLDRFIRYGLDYAYDPEGYRHFANDCAMLAQALSKAGIQNPIHRDDGSWFVADVEAAIYTHLRGWGDA